MKSIHIGNSSLTNSIRKWSSNRTDVTAIACLAVAHHVLDNKEPVVVSFNGEDVYEITVRDLLSC